nr:hypothetical protein [Methylobacterium sp. L1A1]
MSVAPDYSLIRGELADLLRRVAAHATVAACHVESGTDRLMAAEVRIAAASLMSAAGLAAELAPSQQAAGERAA